MMNSNDCNEIVVFKQILTEMHILFVLFFIFIIKL